MSDRSVVGAIVLIVGAYSSRSRPASGVPRLSEDLRSSESDIDDRMPRGAAERDQQMKRIALVTVTSALLIGAIAAPANAATVGDDLSSLPTITAAGTPPAPGLTVVMANTGVGTLDRFPGRCHRDGVPRAGRLDRRRPRASAPVQDPQADRHCQRVHGRRHDAQPGDGAVRPGDRGRCRCRCRFRRATRLASTSSASPSSRSSTAAWAPASRTPACCSTRSRARPSRSGPRTAAMRIAPQAVYELPAPPPAPDKTAPAVSSRSTDQRQVGQVPAVAARQRRERRHEGRAGRPADGLRQLGERGERRKRRSCRNLTATSGKLSQAGRLLARASSSICRQHSPRAMVAGSRQGLAAGPLQGLRACHRRGWQRGHREHRLQGQVAGGQEEVTRLRRRDPLRELEQPVGVVVALDCAAACSCVP